MRTEKSFIQPIIFYRNSFMGGDGWTYYAMRVTIGATCRTCGQPRGPLTGGRVIEDGEYSFVNKWTNECGHQDSFKDAYLEYLYLKNSGQLDANGLPVAGEILPPPNEALHPNDARRIHA